MLDSKQLRTETEAVAHNLARRGFALDLDAFRALEERRKAVQIEADRLRAERNANAKAVGMAKAWCDASPKARAVVDEADRIFADVSKGSPDGRGSANEGDLRHCINFAMPAEACSAAREAD